MHAGRPTVEMTPREHAILRLSGKQYHKHLVTGHSHLAPSSLLPNVSLDHHKPGPPHVSPPNVSHLVRDPAIVYREPHQMPSHVAQPSRLHETSYKPAHVEVHGEVVDDFLKHYEDLVRLLAKHRGMTKEEAHHHLVAALGPHVRPHEAMGFWGNLWGGIKRGLGHVVGKVLEDPAGAVKSVADLVGAISKVAPVV
jgi:hypothetical protein